MTPTVIIPAYQAGHYLDRCLSAVLAAGFDRSEIMVVDDGSTDGSGKIIAEYKIRCLRNETPQGAAAARNLGAAQTDSDILIFIDADIVIHPMTRQQILDKFAQDQTLTALFGSYDDAPAAPGLVSQYRNLLHHHVHQQFSGQIHSFWTGIGAVRRDTFSELGGFDTNWDMMEDVEFGLRLPTDKTMLVPNIMGTHLKEWTLWSMFQCDLWDRAVPWTRLLKSRRAEVGKLNLSRTHQLSAICIGLFCLSLLLSIPAPISLIITFSALVGFLAINVDLWRLLYRVGGLRLMIPSVLFHAVHYGAALTGYLWVHLLDWKTAKQ